MALWGNWYYHNEARNKRHKHGSVCVSVISSYSKALSSSHNKPQYCCKMLGSTVQNSCTSWDEDLGFSAVSDTVLRISAIKGEIKNDWCTKHSTPFVNLTKTARVGNSLNYNTATSTKLAQLPGHERHNLGVVWWPGPGYGLGCLCKYSLPICVHEFWQPAALVRRS